MNILYNTSTINSEDNDIYFHSGNRINSYKFSLTELQEKKPILHIIFKYTMCVLSINSILAHFKQLRFFQSFFFSTKYKKLNWYRLRR